MNANQQIEVLGSLAQPAAAWLVGLSGRTLRDTPDLPRNADGTYDGRKVLGWASHRVGRPELPDVDLERLLNVAESIALVDDARMEAVVDTLDSLRAKHGEWVMLTLLDLLLGDWREQSALYARLENDPEAQRKQAEAERREEEQQDARARLAVAVQCEYCGKVRQGRKWNRGRPPAGYAIVKGLCPACERKTD